MARGTAWHGIFGLFYSGRMDANLLLCGLAGAVLTVVFYTLFPMPLLGSGYIFDLFCSRGWVPYGITLLFFWAAVVLIVKTIAMRRERRYLSANPVSYADSEQITSDTAAQLAKRIGTATGPSDGEVLRNRLTRMMEQLACGAGPDALEAVLRQESEIDAARLSSSYVMVKDFIWAIPVLGFIGTVIGIVRAVSGFSSFVEASVADIAQIKSGLGMVTSGLSVAFETTLLALVVSLVLMFPTSALQKAEENLLSDLDRYCIDTVIGRAAVPKIETPTPESALINKVIEESMRNQLQALEKWKSAFQSTLQGLSDKLSSTIAAYASSQEKNLTEFARTTANLKLSFDQLIQHADRLRLEVIDAATSASNALGSAFQKSAKTLAKERKVAQKGIAALIKSLRKVSDQSASSISNLQSALEKRVDAFTQTVEKQAKIIDLGAQANRSLELLTSTKELITVLEALKAQMTALRPAVERLARPRTVRLVEEEASD